MAVDGSNVHSKWLDEDGQIFEYSAQAPSPSKDFCQVVVTPMQVKIKQCVYVV